jgi:gamma-glutamyltranspeptidase/glutathione hydrolase
VRCRSRLVRGVALASSSRLAAEAGLELAAAGGNAVDAALAAALVSMVTEPGVCSPGAGGYVTIWAADGEPVTIDGNVEMPGRGLPPERLGQGGRPVELAYGGGLRTVVGHGSVATPGALAACELAAQSFGRLDWRSLFAPAVRWARDGFPLSRPSYDYLVHSGTTVYGWDPRSRAALHRPGGGLLEPGETVRIPELADSLEAIAQGGAAEFYRGALGRRIADHVTENGGALTREDMALYRALPRPSLVLELDDWRIATNPPPAIGGTTLGAMLLLMRRNPIERWDAPGVAQIAAIQHRVLAYRHDHLDLSDDLEQDARRLLEACRSDPAWRSAPSTVHTSAVDDDNLGCAITLSSGYGSGVMPPNTGIWLNNCLGEIELNRRGLCGGPPGWRLPSNMAPTVARRTDGAVLAIGSPGADRITTAIFQALFNFVHLGMALGAAIEHPRLHVELLDDGARVACEPGLPLDALQLPARRFDNLSMFFGGVGAALRHPRHGFVIGADPRRSGGSGIFHAPRDGDPPVDSHAH